MEEAEDAQRKIAWSFGRSKEDSTTQKPKLRELKRSLQHALDKLGKRFKQAQKQLCLRALEAISKQAQKGL